MFLKLDSRSPRTHSLESEIFGGVSNNFVLFKRGQSIRKFEEYYCRLFLLIIKKFKLVASTQLCAFSFAFRLKSLIIY